MDVLKGKYNIHHLRLVGTDVFIFSQITLQRFERVSALGEQTRWMMLGDELVWMFARDRSIRWCSYGSNM